VIASRVVPALRLVASLLLGVVLVACSRPAASATLPSSSPLEAASGSSDAIATAATDPAPLEAGKTAGASPAPRPAREAPTLSQAAVTDVLFAADGAHPPSCDTKGEEERIECLIDARFATDPEAARVAQDLFRRTHDVAGLSPAETMEGGWRGTLHLVPALPVGKERKHLEWIADATRDYDAFFEGLTREEPATLRYVWRGLAFRFMRSVGARTPSAYALLVRAEPGEAPVPVVWSIAYNLDGSLNKSADAVRELVFHENFHLNDQDHGDWAVRTLGSTFDSIVARCRTNIACLTPFTPTEMTVRGGTYYAFQPDNGAAVREYAAELALRYYREQRAYLLGLPHPKRFKCGPKENALSWKLLVEEFFGGIDRTPACA
jgi:hypothetical protein